MEMGKTLFEAPRANIFLWRPSELRVIGVDTADGPEHLLYDKRAILAHQRDPRLWDEEMVESMAGESGVVNVVTVKRMEDGIPAVVDGGRRVIHAREAERRFGIQLQLKGEPFRGSDAELLARKTLANAFRVADLPEEIAERMMRMRKDQGLSDVAIGKACGCSPAKVARYLALLDLDQESRQAVAEAGVAPELAPKLRAMEPVERLELIKELAGKSRREQREVVAVKTGSQKASRPGIREIREVLAVRVLPPAVAEALRWTLGECTPEWAPGGGENAAVPREVEEDRV